MSDISMAAADEARDGTMTLEDVMEGRVFVCRNVQWLVRAAWVRLVAEHGVHDPLAVPVHVARAVTPALLAAWQDASNAWLADSHWELSASQARLRAARQRARSGAKDGGAPQEAAGETDEDGVLRRQQPPNTVVAGVLRVAESSGVMDRTLPVDVRLSLESLRELCAQPCAVCGCE